jgi:acyl carrier protein
LALQIFPQAASVVRKGIAIVEAVENARQIVFDAINQVNALRKKNAQIPKDETARLGGQNGVLDSLGLVNLIVAVEESAEDLLGEELILGQDSSVMQQGAFATVGTLIQRVDTLLEESE